MVKPVLIGGIIGLGFLIATIYTGAKNKDINLHKKLAWITAAIAIGHGIYALWLFL